MYFEYFSVILFDSVVFFNSTPAHLRKNLLCFYSFGYSLPDDDLLEIETWKDVINDDYLLLIMQFIGLDNVVRSDHAYLL